MEQLTAAQISAPTAATRPVVSQAAARIPAQTATRAGTPQAAIRGAAALEPQLTADQKKQATLQGVQEWANKPWSAMMLLLLPGWALRKAGSWSVLSKLGLAKAGAHLSALGDAVVHAPQRVSVREIWKLPSAMIDAMAQRYRLNGFSSKWVVAFEGASRKVEHTMGKAHRSTFGVLGSKASAKLDVLGAEKAEGFFGKRLSEFATWRQGRNAKNIGREVTNAVKDKGTVLPGLSRQVAVNVENMSSAGRAVHFDGVAKQANELFKTAGTYEAREVAQEVAQAAGRAAEAARAASAHGESLGKGLSGLTRNLLRSAGRMPVMTVLVGVAAAAASGAAYFGTRHANKTDGQTLDSMRADIGGDKENAYLKHVEQHTRRSGRGRWGSAFLTATSEAVMAGTMNVQNVGAGLFGDAKLMGATGIAMTLPKVGELLVPENPALNAYANLKRAEQSHVQLSAHDKQMLVRQLVGASPLIEPFGGYYNHLAAPVAKKMIDDNMNLHDVMQLLSDEKKLIAYADAVKAQVLKDKVLANENHKPAPSQAANGAHHEHAVTMQDYADEHQAGVREHAEVPCTNPAHKLVAHTHDVARIPATANENRETPRLQVQAESAEHDGMLQERLRAVGQGA